MLMRSMFFVSYLSNYLYSCWRGSNDKNKRGRKQLVVKLLCVAVRAHAKARAYNGKNKNKTNVTPHQIKTT